MALKRRGPSSGEMLPGPMIGSLSRPEPTDAEIADAVYFRQSASSQKSELIRSVSRRGTCVCSAVRAATQTGGWRKSYGRARETEDRDAVTLPPGGVRPLGSCPTPGDPCADLLVGGVACLPLRVLGLIIWNQKKRIPDESPREEAMANIGLSDKMKKASLQRGLYVRNSLIDQRTKAAAPKAPRKPRPRMDPKERSWAHAYLKHVAEVKGLPFIGVRESMQGLARYFGIEVPTDKADAGRSKVAIDLAKKIQDSTGIQIPSQR